MLLLKVTYSNRVLGVMAQCYFKKAISLSSSHLAMCKHNRISLCTLLKYSTEKKTSNLVGKRSLDSVKNGMTFGNWKFYIESLVFKKLRPDVVSSSYKMCYRSELETYANFCILTTAVGTITLSLGLGYSCFYGFVADDISELLVFSVFAITSIIAICRVSLQVPLRIYYSSDIDNFLVFVPTLVPYATKKIFIQPGDVLPPTKSSAYLPWVNLQHTHKQSNQKMLIDGEKFILPMYYNRMMGY